MGLVEEKIAKVLTELKPYVIVVGSFARGDNHARSDIDLYIKRRPEEELDEYWELNLEEHYIDKVIEVFESNQLEWDSLLVGYVHTNTLPIQIEAATYYKIPKNTCIQTKNILGVEMEYAIDNKELDPDDAL